MVCLESLLTHAPLAVRRTASATQIETARNALSNRSALQKMDVSLFCAGSLARGEVGANSDLDIFITTDAADNSPSRLGQYSLFADLIEVNKELGLPPFSNDGEYLRIYALDELIRKTGSRTDDHENLFTARMLLMLESKPLLNDEMYTRHLRAIVEHYYRDQKGKHSFRPLFLLNDILRYWRTLCLNYEEHRHDPRRAWRKKNVNLKFSRLVTVFSSVLPLIAFQPPTPDAFIAICNLTPLERVAKALDAINDSLLIDEWPKILDAYEAFLRWKEDPSIDVKLNTLKNTVREHADHLSDFLYRALTHPTIPIEFRRYLVL